MREVARRIRVETIKAVAHARGGHLGGPLSIAEILATLFFDELRIRPNDPDWSDRDRIILSKGHSSIALYAAMALRGYLPLEELTTFDAIDSRLQGHPDMTRLPGLDMSTGSLGLGLSAGVGIALGAKLAGKDFRTYVIVGDGECQEGNVWEAAYVAERYELDNLLVVVDANGLQQYGWPDHDQANRLPPWRPGELEARWQACGWSVSSVDGHDVAALLPAFEHARATTKVPSVLMAHTVKGRGVSFMEGAYFWHTRVPTDEELRSALTELGEP